MRHLRQLCIQTSNRIYESLSYLSGMKHVDYEIYGSSNIRWNIRNTGNPDSVLVPFSRLLRSCKGQTVVRILHATTFSDISQNHIAPRHAHIHVSNTVLTTPPHSLCTYYSLISMSRMLHFRQPHIHA